MLPDPFLEELNDADIAAVLREAMLVGARGLNRAADLYLATVCAERLVDCLRLEGLLVVRPVMRPGTGTSTNIPSPSS